MPRLETYGGGYTTLDLSPNDTEAWAIKPGEKWPCSRLAGKHVRIDFDPQGDTIDVVIRNREGTHIEPYWYPNEEMLALTNYYLPDGHPGRRDF